MTFECIKFYKIFSFYNFTLIIINLMLILFLQIKVYIILIVSELKCYRSDIFNRRILFI